MKVIGIEIKSNEAILVVLAKDASGQITQTKESAKFKIDDSHNATQVQQFFDQVNSAFDSIRAAKIGIIARNANAKGLRAPSCISFKLEGIIQLYKKKDVQFIWPQTLSAYFKKNQSSLKPTHKYQSSALELAFYLINN